MKQKRMKKNIEMIDEVASQVCACHGRTFKLVHGRVSHEKFIGKPRSEGTKQKISETLRGRSLPEETKQKISEAVRGKNHPNWMGDEAGYFGQHHRAMSDYPTPLGTCQIPGCDEEAKQRARIDHTNLPYHSSLVLPMCPSHNSRHWYNHVVILFEAVEVVA